MEQTLLKVENLEVKFKTLEGMQTAVQYNSLSDH